MASGTINLTQSGTLQGYINWTSTSNGSAANTSNVTAKLYIRKDPTTTTEPTYGYWTFRLTVNGSNYGTTSWYGSVGQSYVNIASYTLNNVAHNADGSKSITISGSCTGPSGTSMSGYTATGSGTAVLDKIPRYATVTQSNTAKTETTITVKWTSDSTIDYVWYKIGTGSWTAVGSVNASSGTYTISGRAANTAYTIYTRVRRKDSQLTTDSSGLSVTTYAYPYCTTAPNFVIGNSVTLSFYNPLKRQFTFSIVANGTELTDSDWKTTGTSYTGLAAMGTQSRLYATIPNAKSATYNVKVTYGSVVSTKTGGTYSVNTSANAPSVTELTYADINSITTAITENDQQIIRNKSTVRYTVTGAAAKNSATVASVKVTVNGLTYTLSASGSSYVGGNAVINSASNVTATATVTDSRGLTATITATMQMLDWIKPTAIINMQRLNNFYSTTNITVDADYSTLDGKNTITITYRAGIQGSGAYTVTGTLQDNVQGSFEADNEQNWSVQVTVEDLFDSTTYTLSLGRGIPIVFYDVDKSSVGINTFPSHDNSFEGLDIYMNKVGIMGLKAVLTSEEDLNDITEQGIYYQPYSANATTAHHYPVPIAGYIQVINAAGLFGSGAEVIHRYISYRHDSGSTPEIYTRSKSGANWSNWTPKPEAALTVNYLSNSYVTSTAVGRIACRRKNGVLWCRGNLNITTAMPASATAEIAQVDDWNSPYDVLISVTAQNGADATLTVGMTASGKITVANYTSVTIPATWYRFNLTVLEDS
ncbi:MAG: hypothetical protein IJ052_01295 [Oscillospiraceae bacterium]|nr:hypothetical protein [Oscillospiraceae bacterium]